MTRQAPTSRPVLPIAGIVTGGLAALLALALLLGGGALLWASSAKTDDGGWWSTDTHPLRTATRALTTRRLDVGTDAPRWLFDSGHLAQVRVSVIGPRPVFVGVARTADLQRYPHGVAHAEVSHLNLDPFRADLVRVPGSRMQVGAPGARRFWAASATGAGRRTVTWPVRRGRWSIVVMNADGTPGVSVAVTAGARVPFVRDLGVGLLAGGGAALLAAAALVGVGAAGLRRRVPEPALHV